jgi:RNA polymerase sigma-70 factor (ECF subfamily)
MDEAELIAQLKRHHIEALEPLVREYQAQAMGAAYLITGSRDEAEDVVQTAFIRAYEHISQFDSARGFKPWFMRIVINTAINQLPKQNNASIDDISNEFYLSAADTIWDSLTEIERQIEENQLRETIISALDKLPGEQRAVVVMRYYLDMEDDEIAQILKRPSGTIKWRLHNARKYLRAILRRKNSKEDLALDI